MSNSKENDKNKGGTDERDFHCMVYEFLYSINNQQQVRESIFYLFILANIVLILITFLSLKQARVIAVDWLAMGYLGSLCMLGYGFIIFLQFFLGIIYNKQLLLKVQLSLYRNIVLYIGMFSIGSLAQPSLYLIALAIFCVLLTIGMTSLFGKESFSKNLIKNEGLPVRGYQLIFDFLLCLYVSGSEKYNNAIVISMTVVSLIIRGLLSSSYRRASSLEYTLIRVAASLNVLYSLHLLINLLFDFVGQHNKYSIFIMVILLFLAESAQNNPLHMDPIPLSYFNGNISSQTFISFTQFILDEIRIVNSDINNSSKTNIIESFFYVHASKCVNADCEISHEIQQSNTQQSSQKQLCSKVYKVAERVFLEHSHQNPEDISMKFSLIAFYRLGFPNRFKITQIVTDLESLTLSWLERSKVYTVKKQLEELQEMDLLETMKMDTSSDQLSFKINSLLRILVDFWAQFLEERVDFNKVVQIGEKLMPAMDAVELQWENTLRVENCASLKAMKIYAEYCLNITNDRKMSQMANDYVGILHKKFSHSNSLQSLSADTETALIVISLNVRQLGKIKLINNQACNMFSYYRGDMEKLYVNDIMPKLYSINHDEILKNFLTFENKKINTDNRLLCGKRKCGFLFQIFLQLQKSITTASEELVFVASIEEVKIPEAMLLVICNEQGEIMDSNSTFHQIFIKNHDRKDTKSITNIQELLPNFYENSSLHEGNYQSFKEAFSTTNFGILEFKFEISKISFQKNPDAGYIIKGYRTLEEKPLLYPQLSLTSSLCQLANDEQLQGMQLKYCRNKNQFVIDNKMSHLRNQKINSKFNIPFLNMGYFDGIFNKDLHEKVEKTQYDSHIKTIRFMRDHFERVEEPESFESEFDCDETNKSDQNELFKLKSEMRNSNTRQTQSQSARIFGFIVSLLMLCAVVILYIQIAIMATQQTQKLHEIEQQYGYRGELAQYITFFQGQKISANSPFFNKWRLSIQEDVASSINQAPLPQPQKQKAMKIVYLQKNAQLNLLVNDSVFALTIQDKLSNQNTVFTFAIFVVVFLLARLAYSFLFLRWHKEQILKVFSLFLTQPEQKTRQIHASCLQFLKNSSALVPHAEETAYRQQIEEAEEDDSPHLKLKKFKNLTSRVGLVEVLKINIFMIFFTLLLVIFSIVYVNRAIQLDKKQDIYRFVLTVMPEYSVQMMKTYFYQASEKVDVVNDQFNDKYQQIQFYMVQDDFQKLQSSVLSLLYNNVCGKFSFYIPQACDEYAGGTMKDGISKMMNWLSSSLRLINSETPSPQNLSTLEDLTVILYEMVKPVVQTMAEDFKSNLNQNYKQIRTTLLVFLIALIIIIGIDFFYSNQYPLKARMRNLESSRSLVRLLPDDIKTKKKVNEYAM